MNTLRNVSFAAFTTVVFSAGSASAMFVSPTSNGGWIIGGTAAAVTAGAYVYEKKELRNTAAATTLYAVYSLKNKQVGGKGTNVITVQDGARVGAFVLSEQGVRWVDNKYNLSRSAADACGVSDDSLVAEVAKEAVIAGLSIGAVTLGEMAVVAAIAALAGSGSNA